MRANRGRDTSPEIRVRSAVHRLGLRFRVHRRPLPKIRRTADFVLPASRVAVFVDGCFWYGCEQHFVAPRINAAFWKAKIADNLRRDRDADQRLTAAGWRVIRIWEHEDPDLAALPISRAVIERSPAGQHRARSTVPVRDIHPTLKGRN